MNIVGLYHSIDDIGNHECHYVKVGDFQKIHNPCIIKFVSEGDATVTYQEEIYKLEAGMIIGADALVNTGETFVEICDSSENIYSLASKSQFCLELTVKGVVPVYFGHVHFSPSPNTILSKIKYRTSCWTIGSQVTVEVIANNIDVYYSYDRPVEIFEFDEFGQKFILFTLEPYQKCVLQDKGGKMRDRYVIIEQTNLEAEEVTRLFQTYCMPFNWSLLNSENQFFTNAV